MVFEYLQSALVSPWRFDVSLSYLPTFNVTVALPGNRKEEDVKGPDFSILRRIYPVGAVLTICAFILVDRFIYHDLAIGILSGGIFGILNTWLIVLLTRSTIDPDARNPVIASLVFFVKIPIVYGILIFAFMKQLIHPAGFAIGLQLFLLTLLCYGALLYFRHTRAMQRQGDDAC